jgi:acyl-CoA thioester hydrolase
MGHMNVQHYVAVFDQAMWHMVLQLGFMPSWITERHQGWVDARYLINFRKELTAGQLFHAESSVQKVGKSSLTTQHRILESETAAVAAEVEITSVYFDLLNRVSQPLPPIIRSAAEAAVGTVA